MIRIVLQQMPSGSEIVEVASGQNYTAAGVLLLFCIYLAWSKYSSRKGYITLLSDKDAKHREALKIKDDMIKAVVDEHKADLKDGIKDYKEVVSDYNKFMNQISAIANVPTRTS